MSRSRLGRSLGDLLSNTLSNDKIEATSKTDSALQELSLTLIQAGQFQPRRDIEPEALEELAASIKAQGILQPIVVRPIEENRYEIIAGERRFRAAQLAGLSKIPAIIKEVDDQTTMALALIENIQREDLSPLDEALAIERLIDEYQLTHDDAAALLGKSRTQISNLLRLLNLEPQVKQWLAEKKLDLGHAKVLLGVIGRQQIQAAEKVIAQGLTVRQTEALINEDKATDPVTEKIARLLTPNLQALQARFAALLSTKAIVKPGKGHRGKLVLPYKNEAELAHWLARLQTLEAVTEE